MEFVAEQAPPLGKIDAGAVVQALADAKPDAIFSSLFAADLQKFVREGNTRGLFKNTPVFNLLAGEPEYLDPLKDETPEGWWVTGYPVERDQHAGAPPLPRGLREALEGLPAPGSVVGYAAVYAVADAMQKAKSADTEKLVAALKGLEMHSPFGPIVWRPIDHQSTMGAYVGQLAQQGRQGRDGQLALRRRREVPALATRKSARCGKSKAELRSVTGSAVLLQFLNGLAGASSLFLVAAGLSLIFGVTRIVNFAHGSLYMLGMYLGRVAVAEGRLLGGVPLAALARRRCSAR